MSTNQEEFWRGMRELRDGIRELKESQNRTDEQQRKTDERMRAIFDEMRADSRRTDEEIRKVDVRIGRLTGRWGDFVEDLLAPSLVARLKEMGFDIENIWRNPESRNDGGKELDLVVLGRFGRRDTVVIASIKSRVQKDDVDDHIKDIERFYDYFRTFPRADRMGAIGGVGAGEGVKTYAQRRGLFFAEIADEVCRISNPTGFKPKIWPRPGR